MVSKTFLWSLVAAVISTVAAQSEEGYVVGVPVASNAASVPIRKSINTIDAERGPTWDLYIQALKAMQNTDASDILSYYQVMGIHGKPFEEWNGGGKAVALIGYCPHGEKLFLPWHRPFVVLYEQILVDHAKRIAATYPASSRSAYIKAAEELRSPYWDWALGGVPKATTHTMVWVNVTENGAVKRKLLYNPLATYKFPEEALDNPDFDPDNRTEMNRCQDPDSYPKTANENLKARPYKRWIHDVFSTSKTFDEFSSTADSGISLEQVHNGIHWDAGCQGQFLDTRFTSFDPLFMLHHTNVDRYWAYWQYMTPAEDIFKGSFKGQPRFSSPKGATITVDSPLHPFLDANGKHHTTKSVRSIEDFGYSYEGLDYRSKTPAELASDAKSLINRLYAPSTNSLGALSKPDSSGNSNRYFANVQVDVAEVERPCAVQLHIEDRLVDEVIVMQHPTEGIAHSGVSLDEALEASSIRDAKPDEVLESIKSALEVSIVNAKGERVPLPSKGLKIELQEASVKMQTQENELPKLDTKSTLEMVPPEHKR